jgi:hypothetical protein
MPALSKLVDKVFKMSPPGDMFSLFPTLFNEDNLPNLWVYADGEKIASHVGYITRWVSLGGCSVKAGLMGAVATDPKYRGKGLASVLVQRALWAAREDGVDIMMISGSRTLYERVGATEAGCHVEATLTSETAKSFARPSVSLAPADWDDLDDLAELYTHRRAYFLRTQEDWSETWTSYQNGARQGGFFKVLEQNQIVAYFVAGKPNKDGKSDIAEWGGSENAMLAALSKLAKTLGATSLKLRFDAARSHLAERLLSAGAKLKFEGFGGTITIVNFEQLMDRLYPWFEQSGSPEAVERSYMEHAGQYVLTLGEEGIALSPINAVKLIFDTTPTVDLEIPELLTTGFPVPIPEYGISYI